MRWGKNERRWNIEKKPPFLRLVRMVRPDKGSLYMEMDVAGRWFDTENVISSPVNLLKNLVTKMLTR